MLANARSMALGSKGTLFVGSRGVGNVYAVVDKGGKRESKSDRQGATAAQRYGFQRWDPLCGRDLTYRQV